ncbi:hypothetical protein Y026_5402 [Burkholderia pseudomallei TSV28]|nr:hypothetical protein Y026_5402 [Burkholderia pseudomallei TSV28]
MTGHSVPFLAFWGAYSFQNVAIVRHCIDPVKTCSRHNG